MQQKSIKKIVIIGPESTGKSSLCEDLANHFNSIWVKEYAREYLETYGTEYVFEDLIKIAEGQLRNEDEGVNQLSKMENKNPVLFIDTDMYVMKVWSEFVFNKCDNRILNQIVARKYDGYLLCNTDLPWTKDNLREYPDLKTREKLFHYYKDALVHQSTPWFTISDIGAKRLQIAIDAVEQLLK